jgi:hypothetical protein
MFGGLMIVVRNTFTAKPGHAGKLVNQLKAMASAGELPNARFFTDVSGDFNTVVMEYGVESLSEIESIMQRYGSDPAVREAAAGYTDHWTTGSRQMFKVE